MKQSTVKDNNQSWLIWKGYRDVIDGTFGRHLWMQTRMGLLVYWQENTNYKAHFNKCESIIIQGKVGVS